MNSKFLHIVSAGVGLALTTALSAGVQVLPGAGTLNTAVSAAAAGDTLWLQTGEYTISSNIDIAQPLSICAEEGAEPVLKMSARFTVSDAVTFRGLSFDGTQTATEGIRYTGKGTQHIQDCHLTGFTSRAIRVYDNAALDSVLIDGCQFTGPCGQVFYVGKSGLVDYVGITRSTFLHLEQGTTKYFIYMNYGEELTDGTRVDMDHCTFYACTDRRGAYFYNVNNVHVTNCIAAYPARVDDTKAFSVYGTASEISHCICYNVDPYGNAMRTSVSSQNPLFVDPTGGDFQLFRNSPAVGAGTDGSNLGDPRWGVADRDADPSDVPYTLCKVPYSMSPTQQSVRILWQTADTVSMGVVAYGTAPDALGDTVRSRSGRMVQGEGFVHVVELTGLQPFTRYYYRVGDGKREDERISSCKTAPAENTAFRMFMLSDIHVNACKNWQNEQAFITQNLQPDFAMFIGDFVNHGWERDWNEAFFTPGAPFLGQVTFSGAVGNHETYDPYSDTPAQRPQGFNNYHTYYDYFSFFSHGQSEGEVIDPRGEAYFTFPYGDAQIICLNLNNNYDAVYDSPSFAKGSRQYEWLDQQLKTATAKWILVYAHVGITTSGYHGQWNADNHTIIRPLLEKYAKEGKHIICFAGDDHSFEHALKDGVHYVRPGCGRNSNYAQVTSLPDAAYTLMYRQVSCFSTLDMAADGETILLTAYDSVGTAFYSYTFTQNDKPLPSVYISHPNSGSCAFTDEMEIGYSTSSLSSATVSLYYTTRNEPTQGTLIAGGLDGSNGMHRYTWNVRAIQPKGTYYLYATITNADTTIARMAATPVVLLADTIAPPAPTQCIYNNDDGVMHLYWENPTRLVHIETLLTDFEQGLDNFQAWDTGEDGTTDVSLADGYQSKNAAHVVFNLQKAWGEVVAAYVFDEAQDLSATPVLHFRYKGDGTARTLRMVVYNDVNGDEIANSQDDWWYTEALSFASTEWKQADLDMSGFAAFDWHTNAEGKNTYKRVKAICFVLSVGTPCTASVDIDDLSLSGEVYPALDFAGTRIVRRSDTYPAHAEDGEIIYDGIEERTIDTSAEPTQTYFYAAFAYDDMGNYSAPAPFDYGEYTGITHTAISAPCPTKYIRNGQLFIVRGTQCYTILGERVR